ncbi:hypothetical protein Tco_1188841 [Tanacetum coccineum]
MVAYLQKPEGSEAFHQIRDFLNVSHIQYALIENPKIYISLIQQFWRTTRTTDDEEVEITASIDGQVKTITEASLKRQLKLEDSDGITSLPNTEIFEQLSLMGTFNFLKMILDAMVKNLDSTHKFLMYPRFLQICLNKQKRLLKPHTRTYPTPTLTQKLFSNMKRVSKGYSGVDFPLFPTMITAPKSSPSRITSSPSLSPQTNQSSPLRDITRQATEIPQSQFPTQTHVADEATFTSVDVNAGGAATTDIGLDTSQGSGTIHKTPTRPYDSPLLRVHTLGGDEGSLQQNELMDLFTKLTNRVEVLENDMQQTKKVYSSALTKLILRVKKLEKKVKTNKAMRRVRIVISEDEDAEEDSSKQGRKISDIDKDPTISLVQPEQDMEYDFDVSTAEGFTTASVPVTIASATLEVSTVAVNLVYIRRSAKKRKDKGKAIMKEGEYVQKKTKKQLDDPAVLRYHALQNRSFSVAEVRKNMCMYLKNQGGYKQSHFKVMKRPGFGFQQKSSKKRSREDSDEDNAKKQKLENDAEKKELRDSMDVVPRDDIAIDIKSLATKYPIVDWNLLL